jgi:hypothetical protein
MAMMEAPPRQSGQTHCRSCGELLLEGDGRVCRICLNRRDKVPAGLVMEWEDAADEGIRLTRREATPWAHPNLAMILISASSAVRAATSRSGKVRLLQQADGEDVLLVALPGTDHPDVFVVDDRARAAAYRSLARSSDPPWGKRRSAVTAPPG